MTKSAMVEALAQRWGGISKRQAEEHLEAWIALLTATVKKEKVLKIPDLGTFRPDGRTAQDSGSAEGEFHSGQDL
jgi:nucleoid DNA-binding protein